MVDFWPGSYGRNSGRTEQLQFGLQRLLGGLDDDDVVVGSGGGDDDDDGNEENVDKGLSKLS